MTRQNSTLTLSNPTFCDQRFAAGHESSPKNDISLFRVAKGSDIRPYELANAGFEMQDFKFFPADFEEVRKRLSDFVVTDESTAYDKVFRFERLPY
ncbi:hypothetical protein [Vibrio parahaemolyticus]|uniref:hypothetical protein n=1 Tax=Vibrio parahaemolyticus TaxID=670 RepID=UPI00193874DD|nr:hypothetical protein [Vibrio parahaemolyticus]QQD06595.1 hypothetical protein JCT85_23800 [Vibrio parahaemolyticus]